MDVMVATFGGVELGRTQEDVLSPGVLFRRKCPTPSSLLCCDSEESTETSRACWHLGWFVCLGNILQCLLIFYPCYSE